MFDLSISNIFLWIISLLLIISIPIILLMRNKKNDKNLQKSVISNKLLNQLKLMSKIYKSEIAYNILIKGHKKNNFVSLPGLLMTKNQIFLFTNVVNEKSNNIILNNNYLEIHENNKTRKLNSINFKDLIFYSNLLANKTEINKDKIIYVTINLKDTKYKIKLDNSKYIISANHLFDFIEGCDKVSIENIPVDKIKSLLLKRNIINSNN